METKFVNPYRHEDMPLHHEVYNYLNLYLFYVDAGFTWKQASRYAIKMQSEKGYLI